MKRHEEIREKMRQIIINRNKKRTSIEIRMNKDGMITIKLVFSQHTQACRSKFSLVLDINIDMNWKWPMWIMQMDIGTWSASNIAYAIG